MSYPLIFDLLGGVYKSATLTRELERYAEEVPGPYFRYAPVLLNTKVVDTLAGRIHLPPRVREILVRQWRGLHASSVANQRSNWGNVHQSFPGVFPELRLAPSTDFGRTCVIAWYASEYDRSGRCGLDDEYIDPDATTLE